MSDSQPGPLVVLIGPPGSGKTTWAREHFPTDEIVGLDELRRTVSGDPNNQEATRFAVDARNVIIRGRMYFGLTTVVDATNAEANDRDTVARMRFMHPGVTGNSYLASVAVIFDTPLKVCLERNARRRGTRRVPEQFIRDCHAAIERDFPVATTWVPWNFSSGLRVRPDGVYRMGGAGLGVRDLPWYAEARSLRDCPEFTWRASAWPV